jgi:hypothetical protein
MLKKPRLPACLLVLALLSVLLAGCGSSAETTTPTNTQEMDIPFQMITVPETLKGFSIPGQKIVYLVTYADQGNTKGVKVTINATADGATVEVVNPEIGPGEVAEIIVSPDSASPGKTIEVKFTGIRGRIKVEKSMTFEVIKGQDDREGYARELQEKFIAWLVINHPELNISADTEWVGTMVSPQWLVVSHYLFFSDEWEMHIEWHIMVAPDDWAKIDLRRRFKETKPSLAFEISSLTAKGNPKAIAVPDELWR